MFHIEADNLLATLWENLRPRPRGFAGPREPELGLMVTLDVRLFSFTSGGEEYRRSALVHTLFTANTSVFVAVSRNYERWFEIDPADFLNTSNHDSCWRTDGMSALRNVYYAMAEEINSERKKDGHSALAPRELNQFCTLGALTQKPWEFVDVTHELLPGASRRRLISIRRKDQQ